MTAVEHAERIKYICDIKDCTYDFAQTIYYESLDKVKKTLDPDEDPLDAQLLELGIEGGIEQFRDWLHPEEPKPKPKSKPEKPVCPKCGNKLQLKNGNKGPFMGCVSWPDCNYTTSKGIEDSTVNGEKVMSRVQAALVFIEAVGGIQKAKAIIAGIEQLENIK